MSLRTKWKRKEAPEETPEEEELTETEEEEELSEDEEEEKAVAMGEAINARLDRMEQALLLMNKGVQLQTVELGGDAGEPPAPSRDVEKEIEKMRAEGKTGAEITAFYMAKE